MLECPETDNSVTFIPDCSSHAFSFRNTGFFYEFHPVELLSNLHFRHYGLYILLHETFS